MNALALAVSLALVSAVCYAAAAVVQERMAADRHARGAWWQALLLTGLGAALHVVSLQYGPLSLMQPLGALSLVLAVPLGAAAAGRRVTSVEWHGSTLTLLGLTGLLLAIAPAPSADVLSLPAVLVVAGVTAAAIAALTAVLRAPGASLRYATAAGIAFGVGSAMTQTVAIPLGRGGMATLGTAGVIVPALLAVSFSLGGLLLSQLAYRGGLGAPLAALTLTNPATAAAIGLALLGDDFRADGLLGPAVALVAAAIAVRGVLLLTRPAAVEAGAAAESGVGAGIGAGAEPGVESGTEAGACLPGGLAPSVG